MNRKDFLRRYNSLVAEMSEYWESDEATGKGSDDIKLAQRWLEPHDDLSLQYNIATLSSVIAGGRDVLAHFDDCAPFVVEALNLGRTRSHENARAWLQRMIPIWETVLKEVEARFRARGGR